jgi:hypothetical protein
MNTHKTAQALAKGAFWIAAWSIFAVSLDAQPSQNPRAAGPALPPPNDTALFLAGMPVPENSPLAPFTRDPAWQAHSGSFEDAFAKTNQRQLQNLREWQSTYLPESKGAIPVAFYMFSGPDFLYVDQFFPNASVYVLCGKEAMGPPPDPFHITDMSAALHNLENAMNAVLTTSYFITKDMKVDLQQQQLNGTLPILYVFLARADKTITDVTLGSLNSSGTFQGGKGGGIPGVRINYRDNRSGNTQTMYYFTTDISDGGIKATPAFLRFCQHLGIGASFLKSSSYLMFEEGFATVRNFILDHSHLIVQDDSGIPISYFNPDKWTLRFFGTYLGPIELFKQHYQPKLQELFAQSNPPPLGFGFGYRWNYKEANLIVATRH